jgi:hypothetical protein
VLPTDLVNELADASVRDRAGGKRSLFPGVIAIQHLPPVDRTNRCPKSRIWRLQSERSVRTILVVIAHELGNTDAKCCSSSTIM